MLQPLKRDSIKISDITFAGKKTVGDQNSMKSESANYYRAAMKCGLHIYCVLHTLSAETAQIIHVHILNTRITGIVPSLHAGY